METTNLAEIVDQYYQFRGLTQPDANQAFLFLVSEIGEISDALVETQAQWVRNNPERARDIKDEIGDALMMLTVFAKTQGIDPIQAMLDKMHKKGFKV